MTDLPAPMVPADADLRDFQFMPLYLTELFNSEFDVVSTDSEWRIGVTLWGKSWHQVPAGSLPDDDRFLCKLAGMGRDMTAWMAVRDGALRGWVKCSDGLLYHPVVAAKAAEAWARKLQHDTEKSAWREKKRRQRQELEEATGGVPGTSQECPPGQLDLSPGTSPGTSVIVPRDVPGDIALKGQGQGQGQCSTAPKGTAVAAGPSLKSQVFGPQRIWLMGASGRSEDAVRRLLGRWCGAHGEGAVLDALLEANRLSPLDPIPYIEAVLKDADDGVISFDEEAVKRRLRGGE